VSVELFTYTSLVRSLVITVSLFVAVSISLAGTLLADQKAKKKNVHDKTTLRSNVRILHDGNGHYIAIARPAKKVIAFYGNGKRFHEMRGYSIGTNTAKRGAFVVQDPRVRGAELKFEKDSAVAHCKRSRNHDEIDTATFRDVSAKEHKKLFDKATFWSPVVQRKPHVLARDAMGVYYFVDRVDDRDFRDFRLFVGEAGAMKRISLKNVANDSVGQVFATKTGALQVTKLKLGLEARSWVKPNRKDSYELVNVPVNANEVLITTTLGVYGEIRLGTFCDDL